jgi:hypothetical protein
MQIDIYYNRNKINKKNNFNLPPSFIWLITDHIYTLILLLTYFYISCKQVQDGMQFHPDPACKLSTTYITYTIHLCTVKKFWWWTEELSKTCSVSFQNKFEKLVHLVGFIIRNLSQCKVTWTSNIYIYIYILFLFYTATTNHMQFYKVLYINVKKRSLSLRFIDNLYSFFHGFWYTGLMMTQN